MTNITKTGTWRHGFTFTAEGTDVTITIEPTINGRSGRIRSYAGWVHGIKGIGPCTPGNPEGKGRIYLGNYKPEFKQMLMARIENELAPQYMVEGGYTFTREVAA